MRIILKYILPLLLFTGTMIFVAVRDAGAPGIRFGEEGSNARSGAMQALEFWSASRAYPESDIPPETYVREFEKSKRALKELRKSGDAITAWHSIGPNNLSGRAISIAVNPLNHNTIYVGSASGGLWRSYTSGLGADWERISTGYPVLGVSSIAIDPGDSNIIFIGTGEVYRYGIALGGLVVRTTRGSFGMGILKTTDNGATWTKSLDWSTNQQRGIQVIKFNPLNPHTMFAGTTDGFYKSTDEGETWNLHIPFQLTQDFVVNPLDTNLILFSTGNFRIGAGIHRTTDGGASWNDISALPSFSGKSLLEMYAGNPNVVYADIADSTTGAGDLWKTTDFGITWSLINPNPGIYGVQGWYSHFITAHPVDSNQLFHASVGWNKSTDGGATYHGAGAGTYSDHHAYAHDPSDPNILYVVNDDGPYRSTDFGDTFTYIGANLPTGQFYNGFSNSTSDSLLAIGQVQDHIPGYIYHGSVNWGRGVVDEVGWTAIDPTNDNNMFAINRDGSSMYKSTNRGTSFQFKANLGGYGAWNSPIVESQSQPGVLYAAKTVIYRSTDGGVSYLATNGGVPLDNNPAISIAVSATNPDIVLVGMAPFATRAEIFRTINGGLTWSNVTGTLPDRYPLDIAFDPGSSQVTYATFGGFGTGHVFKATNTGGLWSDISGTLPDVPTGAVLVDPTNSNYVYVGNDIGVYVTTNGGTSWSAFSEGLPEAVLVSDLSYSPSNRALRVTTHGNGVFERKLDAALPALSVISPNGGESWEAGASHVIVWGSGLVSKIRIEYTTDNGASWIPIADSLPSSAGSYTWYPMKTLTTQARVRVTADEDGGITDQSNGLFTIFFDGTVTTVRNGWNLVSVAVEPPNLSKIALFPAAVSGAFAYEGIYRTRDSLETGYGYWLKYNGAQLNSIKGTTFTARSVNVVKGWNLIGSVSVPISTTQVSSSPPGNLNSPFFGFDSSSRYAVATTLLPSQGYWVHAIGSGTITLSSANMESKQVTDTYHSLQNQITIADLSGKKQTLFFGIGDNSDERRVVELPPAPPPEVFDIRFSTNRIGELVSEGESKRLTINLQGAVYPLTVNWDIAERNLRATLSGGSSESGLMGASGSVVINQTESDVLALTLTSGIIPQTFTLSQNFPNPFNPTTDVRFDVPARVKITLKVYDLIGREIAVLVDELREPGRYLASWNAGNAPSGIYICRLSAGTFTQSRKMLLVK